jgi:N-acetylglutamate synthase-like GNAT family acetyltransferase
MIGKRATGLARQLSLVSGYEERMKPEIRKYEPSDFEACRLLWGELTQRHRDIYGDPTIGGDDPGQAFGPYLANECLHGPWVMEVDGEVVAFAGLIVGAEGAEVEPVVVSSLCRSRGIGTMLVEYVVQEARKLGVRFLNVRPVARNIDAISFFVRAGFDTLGHIDLFQDLLESSERKWKSGIRIHGNKLKY